jgi:hydroxyethylthiazole kinase-like uncharacterized protein yjeF
MRAESCMDWRADLISSYPYCSPVCRGDCERIMAAGGRRMVPVLLAASAKALDEELMAQPGFSIDQLMELAGLAVATAINAEYAPDRYRRVSVLAGPGNNGGDGLVAARHLAHWGYSPRVIYPKRPSSGLFGNLVRQLEDVDVAVDAAVPSGEELRASSDLVVDAVFGFSFKGAVKAPFDAAICAMAECAERGVPIVSVDIPSGWDVDKGPVTDGSQPTWMPEMLVSLTAPKPCAEHFLGKHHYLGGRFVPPRLARKYGIEDVAALYPSSAQIAKI